MSLKQAATHSIKWSLVSQVGRQVMQFVTTAILARLLSPSDFGLLGMATIVIRFIDLFKDLGTSSAVIQQKNLSDALVNSIFWVNVFFGFLGMVILFIFSPLIAEFYQEPRVTLVLKVLSLTFVISGISILQKAILERNLAFNKLAKIELTAIVLGSIVGITLALLEFGVWSLVYQTMTVVTVTTVLLLVATRWKPKMIFSWSELQAVTGYSLNLTGFTILNYLYRNADYLLIGKFLGSQALGYYTLAYRLMLYPLQNISSVIGRVMFPVFSQIQDDDKRFGIAYLKVISTIALITFPMMVGLWALSEPFILTLFGSQWQSVIWLLMILSPVGMVQSLQTTIGTIYRAKGRTDWMFRWSVAETILIVIAFIIGLQWGIIGVATAYAISVFVLAYPGFAIPFRLIHLKVFDLVVAVWQPLVASLLMLGVILGVKFLLPTSLTNAWLLAILIPTGCIAYLLVSWLINRQQMQQLLTMAGRNK